MQIEKYNNTIFLSWNILQECNFSCSYCFANPPKGSVKEIDIERVVERLNRDNASYFIHITGGEPFLIPNFTDLIKEITKKHTVRIDTNLSIGKECEKFVQNINPEKVFEICFSTHIQEWEKRTGGINQLIDTVILFQKNGFNLIGNYVAHPTLMHRIFDDINMFKSKGVKVLPSFFWGSYKGKQYPVHNGGISYSKNELEKLKSYNQNIYNHLHNSKGVLCNAGSTAFSINSNFEVHPCSSIKKKMGDFFNDWNTFEKVIRCPKNHCLCPLNATPVVSSFSNQFPTKTILKSTINDRGVFSLLNSYKVILSTRPKDYLDYAHKIFAKLKKL